jgi:hypothetical protein
MESGKQANRAVPGVQMEEMTMSALNSVLGGAPPSAPFGPQPTALATDASAGGLANATLYRIAALTGLIGAAVLLVNAAKRSGLIATTDLTQLLAPIAEIMALGLVTGLFFAFGRRSGLFGAIAFILHFVSLASLEGVEVVINLVFSKLPMETIAELRAGPLGLVLTVSSLLFLISTLAFVASLAMIKGVPRLALALYGLGAMPIALRAFVPELALDLGLVMLAAGVTWLAMSLWVWSTTILERADV